MNCHVSWIPLIVIVGRSPYMEDLDRASRNIRIHCSQEAKDQEGIVRQWVSGNTRSGLGDRLWM